MRRPRTEHFRRADHCAKRSEAEAKCGQRVKRRRRRNPPGGLGHRGIFCLNLKWTRRYPCALPQALANLSSERGRPKRCTATTYQTKAADLFTTIRVKAAHRCEPYCLVPTTAMIERQTAPQLLELKRYTAS
jgi:hypothetical protein